jgi:sugar (pentulose or hexulose) kinase
MSDVALGVDVGTSYTKAAAVREDGSVASMHRVASPQIGDGGGLAESYRWWRTVGTVIAEALCALASGQDRLVSLCISAVTPMLTVFDAAFPEHSLSIPYWSVAVMEDGSSPPQSDRRLTDRRLVVLKDAARREKFASPCITDLVGYLNFCLTGELTINSISLAEMGMVAGAVDCETLSVGDRIAPRLVAAGRKMGETSDWSARELGVNAGISVCGGCPDTMGSVVGAGLRGAAESMLYLGTFGTLLSLEADVDIILDAPRLSSHPFRWSLSVPGLGPELELLSHEWFGAGNVATGLQMLDSAASKSEPGASGSLFLLPRWKDGMNTVGAFSFVPGGDGQVGDVARRSRAVLESLGYAILVIAGQLTEPLKVSGGGARSTPWLATLSTVLGLEIHSQDLCWEAAGTADIAARLVWKDRRTRNWHIARADTRSDRNNIHENLCRARALYQMKGWI